MKIEITERQAVVLGLAITNYTKALEEYGKKSGALLGADYDEPGQTYKEEARTVLGIITKADNEEKVGTFASFKKELHDLATEAFWYIKKQVDERGRIRPEAKHAGQTLEWDDCDRFPYVGIGSKGEVFMYSDDWNGYTAQDSDILRIAIKLQEGQGDV